MTGTETRSYREGGWGWPVVFAVFLSQFILYGTLKAAGVLITEVHQEFQTTLWTIGLVNSLYYAMQFLLSPFPVAVSHRIGVRPVVVTGGILSSLGLVMASQSNNVPVLAIAMVAMTGTGAACVKEPMFSQMALYFHEKYALVSFLAKLGAPFGMMVYGPATQALTEYYGWRGALLIIAGVSFNLTVCGLLLGRSSNGRSRFKWTSADDPRMSGYQDLDSLGEDGRLYYCCSQLISAMGLAVFKDVRFLLLTTIKFFSGFGYSGIVIYMVPNALSLGLDAHQSSFNTTAWGVGNLLGLSFATLVIHTKVLSECSVMGIGTSLAIMGYALDPYIASFVGQMGVTAIIGAGTESLFLVSIILTRHLTTDNRVAFLYTWQNFITGMSYPFSGFISGFLFEITGDFKVTFFVFSVTMILTGIGIILYYIYTNHKRSPE